MNKTIKSYNKVVGWGIIGALILAVLSSTTLVTMVAGLGMWVFGIWGAVLLIRSK